MGTAGNLKTIILFAILLCCTSCGFSSCDSWGNAPRTEYYIQGGAVNFNPATAVDQQVMDHVQSLFENRELHMGLWRVDADDSDERYKIESGWLSGKSQFRNHGGDPDSEYEYWIDGMLQVDGSTLGFDLDIRTPDEGFANLEAWGTCDYDDAQRLIKQVRLPAWSDNTSTDTVEVTWELIGDYGSEHFSVSFSQVFSGKSRYPVYPWL